MRLYDPLERELPDLGLLVMQDAETGEQLFVDTHDGGFRKRFAAVAERRERELRTAFARAGVDCLELATDGDLVDAILRFADLRKRRSRLVRRRRAARTPGARRMIFLWPEVLWLLFALPLLVALYVWLLRPQERSRGALRQPQHGEGGDRRGRSAGAATCRRRCCCSRSRR